MEIVTSAAATLLGDLLDADAKRQFRSAFVLHGETDSAHSPVTVISLEPGEELGERITNQEHLLLVTKGMLEFQVDAGARTRGAGEIEDVAEDRLLNVRNPGHDAAQLVSFCPRLFAENLDVEPWGGIDALILGPGKWNRQHEHNVVFDSVTPRDPITFHSTP